VAAHEAADLAAGGSAPADAAEAAAPPTKKGTKGKVRPLILCILGLYVCFQGSANHAFADLGVNAGRLML
jgi:hypothetical protein